MIARTTGGLIGLDRRVEIEDGFGTVSERGRTRPLVLTREQVHRMDAAARRVVAAKLGGDSPAEDAVDGGLSEIEIVDGASLVTLVLQAGSAAPDEVWDLLDLVDEVSSEG